MKIVIFTSNAIRHKFIANALTKNTDEALVIVEGKKSDAPSETLDSMTKQEKVFAERFQTEQSFFPGNDVFWAKTLPLLYSEVNLPMVYTAVKDFHPDAGFVFGSSIIKDPLLSLIPSGKFINLHLGLSPYYRGSGTNFWPFVNEELEYVGATLLHIDAGVDTGDIICHVRPEIMAEDTVHTIGCKTIAKGATALVHCLEKLKQNEHLPRTKQWDEPGSKYYRTKDITSQTLTDYDQKLKEGLIANHLKKPTKNIKLIELP